MAPRAKELAGLRFGKLTVKSRSDRLGGIIAWYCECDCGNACVVRGNSLGVKGGTQSCGCLAAEKCRQRKAHGLHGTPEYLAWKGMRDRCHYQTAGFKNYGGRGIAVCDRWRNSFENFLADVGPKPSSCHSLDRYPDNDGNYEPDNVRWATPEQQGRNKRTARYVTFRGETKLLLDFCRELGIPKSTAWNRIFRQGWSVEKALTVAERPIADAPQVFELVR